MDRYGHFTFSCIQCFVAVGGFSKIQILVPGIFMVVSKKQFSSTSCRKCIVTNIFAAGSYPEPLLLLKQAVIIL